MKIQVKHVAMVIVTASLVIPVSATAKEKAAPKVEPVSKASSAIDDLNDEIPF